MLGKLAQIGFNIGTQLMPAVLKVLGLPTDSAKTATGHSSLITGLLLGAGAAFILTSVALGVVTGGAAIAPGILGAALLQGSIGVAAGSIGWGLWRAGEHQLGFSLVDKVKNLLNPKNPPATPPQASAMHGLRPQQQPALQKVVSFAPAGRLAHNFGNVSARKVTPFVPRIFKAVPGPHL